jgi:type I restriction enzyme, S subunit
MFGDPVRNPKGWEIKRFKEIALIDRDTILPKEIDADIKCIGLEHIEKYTGKLLKYDLVGNIEIKSNKFKFTKFHVLYGKLRPYLNKVCLPMIDGICSTDIIPIKPINNKSHRYFIAYLMKQQYFIEKATIHSSGANLPRISPEALNNFQVYLPPYKEQLKFSNIFEKFDLIRKKQEESEKDLERLYSSLMQKAFKGKLHFNEKGLT